MTYLDQVKLSQSGDFRKRVRMALITAAVQIQGEALALPLTTSSYGKRQTLANKVLRTAGQGDQADPILDSFVWAVVQNAAIVSASLDSDIQFQVNAVFSDLAGVQGIAPDV